MQNRLVRVFAVVGLGVALSLLLRADETTSPPKFPLPTNSEPDGPVKALPPDEAARGFRVPDGFNVSVFAAEPDVQNPIAMAWDGRGRLWVAENYTYADRTKKFDLSLRDRVRIFEDTDGDGRHDKRTVFTDDVQMLTGIEIGYGGVWLMTPPNLVFVPDANQDDKPDGAPVVMLDGFTPATDNYHTFANGLKWGPDGWLYGRCGASSPGRLGAPGTPDAQRVPLNGGIWRYRAASLSPSPRRRGPGRGGDEGTGVDPQSAPLPNPPRRGEGTRQKTEAEERTPHPNLRPSKARGEGTGEDKAVIVEVLCHGTTNPWGMDWNEHGEAFFINTVNGHLWHVIPGAHFMRPHSEDPNPHVYELIDQHADHYHWDTGKDWTDSRKVTGEHDRLGGGHAHSGATIYLGDNWPQEYRGRLLTLNLHGRRVNVEQLEREGSGYVGKHEPDMLHAADPWFRGIDLSYGPDGAVYILDWSDTGECHEHTGVHRTSGRIYRVKFSSRSDRDSGESGGVSPRIPSTKSPGTDAARLTSFDSASSSLRLSQLATNDLAALHRHPNEWFVRQARRALVERIGPFGTSRDEAERAAIFAEFREMFKKEADVVVKLRVLWTLFQLEAIDQDELLKLTRHPSEHIRAWAVRLLTDNCPIDTIQGQPHPFAKAPSDEVIRELVRMAREDDSGLVRLALASTLQRLPVERRLELAAPLAARPEDADDHNLPLMVWYGLMPTLAPLAPALRGEGLGVRGVEAGDRSFIGSSQRKEKPPHPNPLPAKPGRGDKQEDAVSGPIALAQFATDGRFPTTRRLIARRLAELIDEHPKAVEELLARAKGDESLQDILDGLAAGFAGRHKVKVPSSWEGVQQRVASIESEKLRARVRDLSVLFGDGRALDEVKRIALDGKAEMASRKAALQTLIDNKPDDLREVCEKLLAVRSLNTVAVRGLAAFDDPALGDKLAKNYRSFYPQERPAVIETLVSRPAFAKGLLSEMAAGKIARADLSAFQVRQLRSFGNAELTQQLTEVWGELRDSPDDKKQLAAKIKAQQTPEALQAADKSAGRAVFNKLCANCHRLYGHGGAIGPDLTGAGRHNLDYVVDNMVDPNAVVGADYRLSVVVLNDGRVLNGLVSGKTDRALTLQTAKDRVTLALADIDELQASSLSLMPEGQLQPLTDAEVRDLVGYLMHPTQVPLP